MTADCEGGSVLVARPYEYVFWPHSGQPQLPIQGIVGDTPLKRSLVDHCMVSGLNKSTYCDLPLLRTLRMVFFYRVET